MLSPVLAARFPTTNENIERGQLVDSQASNDLLDGPPATDPEAIKVVRWLRENLIITHVQQRIELLDDSGTIVTAGTPDFVGLDTWNSETLIVVDAKKRMQWDIGKIPPPDESLQLHAYCLAHARGKYKRYRAAYLLFGDGEVEPIWSKEYSPDDWAPMYDRIVAIRARISQQQETGSSLSGDATKDQDPPPTSGPHCTDCYARNHCPSWAMPAHQGESALAPFTVPGGLTPQNIERAYLAYKAVKDMADVAKELLQAYRLREGPGSVTVGDKSWEPVTMRGRKTADVGRLVADGLSGYVREGDSYETWRLVRRK